MEFLHHWDWPLLGPDEDRIRRDVQRNVERIWDLAAGFPIQRRRVYESLCVKETEECNHYIARLQISLEYLHVTP